MGAMETQEESLEAELFRMKNLTHQLDSDEDKYLPGPVDYTVSETNHMPLAFCPKPVAPQEIDLTKMWDLTLDLLEFHTIGFKSSIQHIHILL